MLAQSIFSVLAVVATTVVAEDAPVINKNPIGAQYQALFPASKPWNVAGSVKIATGAAGKGVHVELALSGLPTEGGPFMYHIHEKPVPEDGNCTATGAHLDPYKRGEVPICDATKKETCQTGDLSGKYGNITAVNGAWSAEYVDNYLATKESDPSYFGELSIVVHLANKTRIGCANFEQLSPGAGQPPHTTHASSGTALPSSSSGLGDHNGTVTSTAIVTPTGAPIQPTASPTGQEPPPSEGGAEKVAAGGVAALFAFAMMLL